MVILIDTNILLDFSSSSIEAISPIDFIKKEGGK